MLNSITLLTDMLNTVLAARGEPLLIVPPYTYDEQGVAAVQYNLGHDSINAAKINITFTETKILSVTESDVMTINNIDDAVYDYIDAVWGLAKVVNEWSGYA